MCSNLLSPLSVKFHEVRSTNISEKIQHSFQNSNINFQEEKPCVRILLLIDSPETVMRQMNTFSLFFPLFSKEKKALVRDSQLLQSLKTLVACS